MMICKLVMNLVSITPVNNISVVSIQRNLPSMMINSTSKRKRKLSPLTNMELSEGCRLGLDTHADISCLGRHARILSIVEGTECTVHAFNDSYAPMHGVKTVNGAIAVDTDDGNIYILHINNALDFTSSMEHSLLCTNQARYQGIIINDIPKLLSSVSTQDIIFPDDGITIPLHMNGPVPYINMRYPTDFDLTEGTHIHLTPEDNWDPQCLTTLDKGISSLSSDIYENYYDDDSMYESDIKSILESRILIQGIKHKRGSSFTPEYLAKLWNISIPSAKLILDATTQDSIRTGQMERRVPTKPHQSRYRQLGGYYSKFASDTFKSQFVSLRGNIYTQLFCNRAGYVRVYPMKRKSDAHHALSRFLHEVGIPSELLTDGALELTLSEWGKLCFKLSIVK